MDKNKLIEKIRDNKKNLANTYYKLIKKIIKEDPEYYKNKKYAEEFLESRKWMIFKL